MERYEIGMGDFLKNAGISGLVYLLKIAGAEANVVYGITEDGQKLWLDADFAIQADWTDLYFRACTEYFGPSTAYQGVLDRIESCLEKLETDRWQPEKREKEDLKYINEKLLSNSYQAGYENIELLEDSVLYELSVDKLHDLYLADIHIANWGRKFAERECIKSEQLFISRQFKTSLERYQDLIADYPDILQRVPLGIIASYLGISQVSLSRIRAKIR